MPRWITLRLLILLTEDSGFKKYLYFGQINYPETLLLPGKEQRNLIET